MPASSGRFEIRIRKLSWVDAKQKLITQLNQAFLEGKKRVYIIHGIGEGKLKNLSLEVVTELGLGVVVENSIEFNPGVTIVDLNPPDRYKLRQYVKL